jgi:hypothetical protein
MNQQIQIKRVSDFPVSSLDGDAWTNAVTSSITNYWNGSDAPASRHAEVELLWTGSDLLVRFRAHQIEPLIISDYPILDKKTLGLWDRDVCEIFIAPDPSLPTKYFEFEVAPTGEWIDLALEVGGKERTTDWDYASGMESAARIDAGKIVMAMKIPFTALGRLPTAGDIWLGNLFRCVGAGPDRGYLAWRPTGTDTPSFHVPAVFGELHFMP